jgi:hypothetical protein
LDGENPSPSAPRDAVDGRSIARPELGEFRPPADYQFEPELVGPTPRPIPDVLRAGPYGRSRRRGLYALAWVVCLCLVSANFWLVKEVGKYILPFAYLSWIGWGAAVIWVAAFLGSRFRLGPYRYVRDGIPTVARILEIVKAPSVIVEGTPSQHAFNAIIEVRHAGSDKPVLAQVKSFDFGTWRKDAYHTTYRVGDYATAVYLPNEFEKSLQMYGFLGLRTDLGVVYGRTPANSKRELWEIPLSIGVVCLFVGGLIWMAYVFQRMSPVDFDFWKVAWPMAVGVVGAGTVAVMGAYFARRSEVSKLERRNREAVESGDAVEADAPSLWKPTERKGWFILVLAGFGVLMLGGAFGVAVAFAVNGWGDESPHKKQLVKIEGLYTETHSAIFRQYFIKYLLPDSKNTERYYTSPDDLDRFQTDAGLMETHGGRLGWPWVYAIHPINLAPNPPQQ